MIRICATRTISLFLALPPSVPKHLVFWRHSTLAACTRRILSKTLECRCVSAVYTIGGARAWASRPMPISSELFYLASVLRAVKLCQALASRLYLPSCITV